MFGAGSTAAVHGKRRACGQGLVGVLTVLAASIFSQDVIAQNVDDMVYRWHRAISATGGQGIHHIIALDTGGFLVAGGLYTSADFDPGPGVVTLSNEVYIAKYTEDGDFVWVRGFDVYPEISAIAVDDDGNIHLGGLFGGGPALDFDPGPGVFELEADYDGDDVYYVKLNADGEFVMAFDIDSVDPIGPLDRAPFDLNHIKVDGAGNVYLIGGIGNPIDIDPGVGVTTLTPVGEYDIGVVKFNSAGDFQWARLLGGVDFEYVTACTVTADGKVYGAGLSSINDISGVGKFYAFALDTTGNVQWEYETGDIHNYAFPIPAIALDSVGDVVLTAPFTGTYDFDTGVGVTQLTSLPTSTVDDSTDIFVLKLDGSTGNLEWVKQLGSTRDDASKTLRVTPDDEILIGGTFLLHTELDPGPGTAPLVAPSGYTDTVGFVSALDSAGDFLWAKRIGAVQLVTAMALEDDGSILFGGITTYTRDLIPGPLESMYTAVSGSDGYFVYMANIDGLPNISKTGFILLIGLILMMGLFRLRSKQRA